MDFIAEFLGMTPTMPLRHFIWLACAILAGWAIALLTCYANLLASRIKVKASDTISTLFITSGIIIALSFLYTYGVDKDLSPVIPDTAYEILGRDNPSPTLLTDRYIEMRMTEDIPVDSN